MTDEEEVKLHKAAFDKWLSGFMEATGQALNYTVNRNKNKENGAMSTDTLDKREIKFRGQMRKSLDWVYGDLEHYNEHVVMVDGFIVFQETVGQYTGLKDKNGVEIYEGDIVKVPDFEGKYFIGKVEYSINTCCYRIVGDLFNYALILSQEDIEVIGNIYDNPELLEVRKC